MRDERNPDEYARRGGASAAYRCPDCGFTAPLVVTVSQHMWDEHHDDHPGETPWLNRETGEHYWEDEDALDE